MEERPYEAWELEQRIAAERERRRPVPPPLPDLDEYMEMLFERGWFDD